MNTQASFTLPGPTAFVPALVASALPCDRFVFEGFLPVKKGRQTRLNELRAEPRTMIFYESPHRVLRTLAACGTTETKQAGDPKAMEMRNRIRTMEDSLFNSSLFDQRNAQALLDVYKAYATALPLDSMAPEYLFRAAGVARSMKDPQQSVFLYDRVLSDYPGWYKLVDVYYLKAFVIDIDLGQKGEAKQAYQTVINRYPDHPFAEQARLSIENLPYTNEELIEKFQRMSEEQEAKAAQ